MFDETYQDAADAPIGFTKPKAEKRRGAKKLASIERRRRLAACWPLPPSAACKFTTCELAAIRIIANELRRYGICTMPNGKIAAIAGTCVTCVKDALRKAKRERLLKVEERRRAGQRSLTNVVKFLCMAWKEWIIRHKGGGVGNTTTTDKFIFPLVENRIPVGLAMRKFERPVPAGP